jgi:hypothetical protein
VTIFLIFLGPVLMCLSLGLTANMMIANLFTHIDRTALLSRAMWRMRTGAELWAAFDAVTYNQHLLRRFFWRDPWKLYPEVVREAMKNRVVFEAPEVKIMLGGMLVAAAPDGDDDKKQGPTLQ